MPAIANLVATLENDHAEAMAKAELLTAANEALIEKINTIASEKAALEARVAELTEHNDALITMAEGVANNALNMLKATRLPKGTPAAVIPYAPKTATDRLQAASIANDHATDNPIDATAAQNPGASGDENRIHLIAAADPPLIPAPPSWAEPTAPSVAEFPTSAMDRIKRHLLPALTLTRRPVDLSTPARHGPGGLPMFLRRDTVFARMADAA
jgi:hypothetical protein